MPANEEGGIEVPIGRLKEQQAGFADCALLPVANGEPLNKGSRDVAVSLGRPRFASAKD